MISEWLYIIRQHLEEILNSKGDKVWSASSSVKWNSIFEFILQFLFKKMRDTTNPDASIKKSIDNLEKLKHMKNERKTLKTRPKKINVEKNKKNNSCSNDQAKLSREDNKNEDKLDRKIIRNGFNHRLNKHQESDIENAIMKNGSNHQLHRIIKRLRKDDERRKSICKHLKRILNKYN